MVQRVGMVKPLLAATIAVVLCMDLFAEGAIEDDRVSSLPGWKQSLPSKQYAGYLAVGDGKYLHYWFVESENDPSSDPVVLWLNGGPGCSSMDGFFHEQGPFVVDKESGELSLRPTRWNKIANMIWLDAPAGVGLSYATNSQGYVHNDTSTAIDNYHALIQFFEGFSEFQANELFLTGESYAGVYIPTLAYQIHQAQTSDSQVKLNLKGIMVGNGCTGTEVGACSLTQLLPIHVEYLYRMGLFSSRLHAEIGQECKNFTIDCIEKLVDMVFEVGPIDIYNVLGKCINGEIPLASRQRKTGVFSRRPSSQVEAMIQKRIEERSNLPPFGPLECGMEAPEVVNYLDDAAVRSAIHAKPTGEIGNFSMCGANISYTPTEPNLPRDIYPNLIGNYRVTIYNGDADACVPFTDNEAWTSGMNMSVVQRWSPWYTAGSGNDQQVAGYLTQYAQDFNFVIVKGAGHMVPQFTPQSGFELFQNYLNNKWSQ
eukprot:gb/GECG01010085.1/.p1 GENE.gb/GECG01010085.1/~~gb/GECG01010085.1/.p1  ORF type:complete len:483 (+),score=47.09 gb/GECG01010085.1/:1-1449(+)